jgi:23S rRNA pseudouridine1911/1915/1917 synthase
VTEPPRSLRVGPADRGRRLDLFLAEKLALSRAQARRLLARGAVRVDGRLLAESAKGRPLPAGASVEVEPFRRPEQQRVEPEPGAALQVRASGPGWLAVDKPAGTPVHPLEEDERGTLLGALAARHPEFHGVGEGGLRSGVVHRLDVDTSGVLLFATEEAVWQRLRHAFQTHRVEKVYRALVCGRLEHEGRVEVGLVMARHRPARVRVMGAHERERARGVRDGILSWRPLEVFAAASLVEVRPVTGFLHQIRVILAERGFPLLGDRVYGDPAAAGAAPRHMLHAASLRFEEVAATSPDPPDFAELCDRLREGGRV